MQPRVVVVVAAVAVVAVADGCGDKTSRCLAVERSHCELSNHTGHFVRDSHCSDPHRMTDADKPGTHGAGAGVVAVIRASKASPRRSSDDGRVADLLSRRGDRRA